MVELRTLYSLSHDSEQQLRVQIRSHADFGLTQQTQLCQLQQSALEQQQQLLQLKEQLVRVERTADEQRREVTRLQRLLRLSQRESFEPPDTVPRAHVHQQAHAQAVGQAQCGPTANVFSSSASLQFDVRSADDELEQIISGAFAQTNTSRTYLQMQHSSVQPTATHSSAAPCSSRARLYR